MAVNALNSSLEIAAGRLCGSARRYDSADHNAIVSESCSVNRGP